MGVERSGNLINLEGDNFVDSIDACVDFPIYQDLQLELIDLLPFYQHHQEEVMM